MKYSYLFVFALFFVTFVPVQDAFARHKHTFLSPLFTPEEDDHDDHYLHEGKYAYDSDWENGWNPLMWAESYDEAQTLVDQFYADGVVVDQYMNDEKPCLEVGQRFLELSGRDQRRVVKFMAYAFDVDGFSQDGAVNVVLKRAGRVHDVGVYSQGRVQLH